jgi:hypothetical protein
VLEAVEALAVQAVLEAVMVLQVVKAVELPLLDPLPYVPAALPALLLQATHLLLGTQRALEVALFLNLEKV